MDSGTLMFQRARALAYSAGPLGLCLSLRMALTVSDLDGPAKGPPKPVTAPANPTITLEMAMRDSGPAIVNTRWRERDKRGNVKTYRGTTGQRGDKKVGRELREGNR